jgi:hypothetical protein
MLEESHRVMERGLKDRGLRASIPRLEEGPLQCRCAECRNPGNPPPAEHTKYPVQLEPDAMLLCSSQVCAFIFATKGWRKLFVSDLSDIKWAANPMDNLVTSSEVQKKLILGLVQSLQYDGNTAASPLERKGTGLIMLLHGPPGCGKTLTAGKRPYYALPVLRT